MGAGAWAYLTAKGVDYDYNVDHFFKAWYVADPAAVADTVSSDAGGTEDVATSILEIPLLRFSSALWKM
jgi:hypothetical protein